METKCGKHTHVVGTGICGLVVVQVEIAEGNWLIGKMLNQSTIKIFGDADVTYEIKEEPKGL